MWNHKRSPRHKLEMELASKKNETKKLKKLKKVKLVIVETLEIDAEIDRLIASFVQPVLRSERPVYVMTEVDGWF